jgi:hypothetical protein
LAPSLAPIAGVLAATVRRWRRPRGRWQGLRPLHGRARRRRCRRAPWAWPRCPGGSGWGSSCADCDDACSMLKAASATAASCIARPIAVHPLLLSDKGWGAGLGADTCPHNAGGLVIVVIRWSDGHIVLVLAHDGGGWAAAAHAHELVDPPMLQLLV